MAFLFSCMALIGTASSCADDYNTDPLTKNTILSSITIDEKYEVYTLVKGENYTLHFSTLPEDATNPGVSWVSGNEEVATVDANGKVTAVAVGTSVITAKPAVGYADGVSAAITISVVEELALTQSVEITNLPEELTMMETQSVQLKTKLYRRNLVSIFYRGKVAMRKWLRLMKTGEYWLWEKEKRQLLQQLQMARICPIQLR